MPNRLTFNVCGGAAGLAIGLGGCMERHITITSQPEGALVWVNDVEVGRTPCDTDFTFYGDYDVRLRLDGYEPMQREMAAEAPWYEYPPFDLFANAVPGGVETKVRWHFVLEKQAALTEEGEQSLIDRARELRGRVDKPAPKAP